MSDSGVVPPMIQPMLATPASSLRVLPAGEWRLEPKLDGWRALVTIDDDQVTIRTRRGRDISAVLPELSRPPRGARGRQVLLDGELIVGAGTCDDFYLVGPRLARSARSAHLGPLVSFVAFDVLWLDGRSLCDLPYGTRRAMLEQLRLSKGSWRTAASLEDDPQRVLDACQQLHIEGIVAKRLDGRYRAGRRSNDWIKFKTEDWSLGHAPRRKTA